LKFIFILLIQCIWSTQAASPVAPAELKTALAKYQAMASLEVPFKQIKTLKDIQLRLESEGILKVQLPNRVEWKVLKPQPLEMVLEQDKVTVKSDGKEDTFRASEGSAKDQRSFHDLLNWLRLDADALTRDYQVSRLSPNRYRFVAKNPDSVIKALNMDLSKAGHLQKLTFEEAAGDEIRIEFGIPQVKYQRKVK